MAAIQVIPGGGVTAAGSAPLTGQASTIPTWGSAQSPLQYFMANGGNPALSQQYLSYLSALPPALAQQVAANPAQGFALWKQGVGTNPESQGLTFQNGQYVNAQGQAYDRNTDPAAQADMANQSNQWNQMIQNSSLYNNGGRANVQTAANPYGYVNQGTVTAHGGINPMNVAPVAATTGGNGSKLPGPLAPPTQGTQPGSTQNTGTGGGSGTGNGQLPPPASPPPVSNGGAVVNTNTKDNQLSQTGAAQYTQPVQQANNQPGNPAGGNAYSSGGSVNPYSGVGASLRANPYRLNTNGSGWNF